jgi:hypothetical protein
MGCVALRSAPELTVNENCHQSKLCCLSRRPLHASFHQTTGTGALQENKARTLPGVHLTNGTGRPSHASDGLHKDVPPCFLAHSLIHVSPLCLS